MSKKIVTVVASVIGVAVAVAFLSHLALHIGELPLAIIVFGVMGLMLRDYIDTVRTSLRAADNANGNGQANGPASSG